MKAMQMTYPTDDAMIAMIHLPLIFESVFHQSSSSSTCPVQLNVLQVNSNYLNEINEIVNLMKSPANESAHPPSQTITTLFFNG